MKLHTLCVRGCMCLCVLMCACPESTRMRLNACAMNAFLHKTHVQAP
uniref:Uncharacterized protein n=1 Tax=Anguilla anguilla TaxID=7936 RepID=A0A0E9R8V3_ANGAN